MSCWKRRRWYQLFLLNVLCRHLENSGSFARLLFVDFSSAFNLLQPVILGQKPINQFHFNHGIVSWIMNFLIDRQQRVMDNGVLSDIVNISIGWSWSLTKILMQLLKSHQRLFVLRKLNSFNPQVILQFVESFLSFSFICWFLLLSTKIVCKVLLICVQKSW